MPWLPQDLKGRKLSLQVAEGDLGYVQGTLESGFPGPPHSVISKDIRYIQTQTQLLCLWCGRFIPTDASQPRALEGRGVGCGKTEREELSPASEGGGLVTFPSLEQLRVCSKM